MKLNLEAVLRDMAGNPRRHIVAKENELGMTIVDPVTREPVLENKGELKLKDVLVVAVNSTYKDETPAPAEIYKRGKLARKVCGGGEKHFSSDEISKMRALVEKRYAHEPFLVLSIGELIDPENENVKEAAEAAPE